MSAPSSVAMTASSQPAASSGIEPGPSATAASAASAAEASSQAESLPLEQMCSFRGSNGLFSAAQVQVLHEIWHQQGYVFLPGNNTTRAFVARVARLQTKSLPPSAKTHISGKVEQFDQDSRGAEFIAEFGADWDAFVRRLVSEVTGEDTSQRYVKAHKLLQVKPGEGEQPIHLDRDDERLGEVYSIVLYCTSGVSSTAFPATFTARDFATNGDAGAMRATIEAGRLDKAAYHSVRVEAGDIAIFRQSTPHYGTMNDTNTTRTVLFSMLTPFDDDGQDEFQTFRWMYFEEAYGIESRQLAQALHDDREHNPLKQCSTQTKEGRAMLAAYRKCLRRWGFTSSSKKRRKSDVGEQDSKKFRLA